MSDSHSTSNEESRPHWDRDWLIEQYYGLDKSMTRMADEADTTIKSVRRKMRQYGVHPNHTDDVSQFDPDQ